MTTADAKKSRQMPKGGRKGGSVFPRVNLTDAIGYARKLVSKTHVVPQPRDVIYSGVVGAKSGIGNIRISALKQYGLLKGDNKANYSAEDLAKRIVSAPSDEVKPLLQMAMLKPTVFKKLFDTFHGDSVSRAKLKQRAADLKVHPDETDTCVGIYIEGLEAASLATVDGDQVQHVSMSDIGSISQSTEGLDSSNAELEVEAREGDQVEENFTGESPPGSKEGNAASDALADDGKHMGTAMNGAPRVVFNVNVTLDSSLDTDKLQKQLELLKRFGAI